MNSSKDLQKENEVKKHAVLILACALVMAVPGMATSDLDPTSASAVQQPTAVVLKFAVQSQSMPGTAALSLQACPQDNHDTESNAGASASAADAVNNNPTIDPKLLDAISSALQRDFSKKKMSVWVDPEPDAIPVGAQIISGCIFQAQKGNVGKRMVGFGWGASQIGAHVVVLSKTSTGFAPVDSFDVQVKARNILPPIGVVGLAINAAKAPSQTLSADANKLAGQIVKKLNEHTKQQAVNGNSSHA
jgi:Domain of unknown function (DUF4410)